MSSATTASARSSADSARSLLVSSFAANAARAPSPPRRARRPSPPRRPSRVVPSPSSSPPRRRAAPRRSPRPSPPASPSSPRDWREATPRRFPRDDGRRAAVAAAARPRHRSSATRPDSRRARRVIARVAVTLARRSASFARVAISVLIRASRVAASAASKAATRDSSAGEIRRGATFAFHRVVRVVRRRVRVGSRGRHLARESFDDGVEERATTRGRVGDVSLRLRRGVGATRLRSVSRARAPRSDAPPPRPPPRTRSRQPPRASPPRVSRVQPRATPRPTRREASPSPPPPRDAAAAARARGDGVVHRRAATKRVRLGRRDRVLVFGDADARLRRVRLLAKRQRVGGVRSRVPPRRVETHANDGNRGTTTRDVRRPHRVRATVVGERGGIARSGANGDAENRELVLDEEASDDSRSASSTRRAPRFAAIGRRRRGRWVSG